jgi:tRNA-2-methylthio-N6-dimethylallyladenosine synthase
VEVLIEKESKKSNTHWAGRNEQNTMVVFPKGSHKIGDFVKVKILECTSATLIGVSQDL